MHIDTVDKLVLHRHGPSVEMHQPDRQPAKLTRCLGEPEDECLGTWLIERISSQALPAAAGNVDCRVDRAPKLGIVAGVRAHPLDAVVPCLLQSIRGEIVAFFQPARSLTVVINPGSIEGDEPVEAAIGFRGADTSFCYGRAKCEDRAAMRREVAQIENVPVPSAAELG